MKATPKPGDRDVRHVQLHRAPRFKDPAVLLYSVSSVIFELSESRGEAKGKPVRHD